MPSHKRPFNAAEAQPPPPPSEPPVLPQPTVRQRGELAMENWDLSTASEAERARAQDLVDSFNAIKGDMSGVWREELAAFIHDCTWQRLAPNPSSLESYKKLKGNAGRQKSLYYPYWFEVATYFPPSHATLQPIREELSQLWGVNFPSDRIYYPQVDAKKESACFQGNPLILPTGNGPAPARKFTPINAATTSTLAQPSVTQSTLAPPSVTQSTFASSNLFPVDNTPKWTNAARPRPISPLKPILKERPTSSPTPSTATLANWNMTMSALKEKFSGPANTPRKRSVTFDDSTVDNERPSSSLSRSDGRPFSRPSSPAQPPGQRPLPTPPAPTDVEQQSVFGRSLGFGSDLGEKKTETLRMRIEEAYRRLDALEANIEGFEMRFAVTDSRFAAAETKTTRVREKVDGIRSVVNDSAEKLGIFAQSIRADDRTRLNGFEERLTRVEAKMQLAYEKATAAYEKATSADEKATAVYEKATAADEKATAVYEQGSEADEKATAAYQQASDALERIQSLADLLHQRWNLQ